MAFSLSDRISRSLPEGVILHIHHFAALPTSVDPLFVAAKDTEPEPTELESHFLSASIMYDKKLVHVLAIEVLIYTTATLTTLFVSKADSSGYLYLLNAPRSTRSIIQTIITEFLSYLLDSKKTDCTRTVLSLFARAQDQYIFPGSIENEKKHVLDDRGLIKWWGKIIERIQRIDQSFSDLNKDHVQPDFKRRAHIVVPGCDVHETKAFIPRDKENKPSLLWDIGDPLKTLGKLVDTPERCLIPRFPDDPKARFAIDLDDELPDEAGPGATIPAGGVVTLKKRSDKWRSVRSLAQFWEMMSFRQECSAGRLVGFLWGIWEPVGLADKPHQSRPDSAETDSKTNSSSLPALRSDTSTSESSQQQEDRTNDVSTIETDIFNEAGSPLKSQTLVVRQTQSSPRDTEPTAKGPNPPSAATTPPEEVPPLIKSAVAELTMSPDAYASCISVILTLDYCDFETAAKSTKEFIDVVTKESGRDNWGVQVTGTLVENEECNTTTTSEINNLALSIKKRSRTEGASILNASLVRKKSKT